LQNEAWGLQLLHATGVRVALQPSSQVSRSDTAPFGPQVATVVVS
jgi:hypothetical protein